MVELASTVRPPSAPELESAAQTLVLTPTVESLELEPVTLCQGRHSVGTDESCDVVLPFSGIAGRHCLIVVGPRRTVVKALSPLTWINEGPVHDDPLHPGDRLTLGPIEFDVRVSASAGDTPVREVPEQLQAILNEAAARRELHDVVAAAAIDGGEDLNPTPVEAQQKSAADSQASDVMELDFTCPRPAGTNDSQYCASTEPMLDPFYDDQSNAGTVRRPISRDVLFAEREAIDQSRLALQQQREHLARLAESLEKRDRELSVRHADIGDTRERMELERARLSDWEARLTDEREALARETAAHRADRDRLDAEHSRLERELKELQRQRNTLAGREDMMRREQEQLRHAQQEQQNRGLELEERSELLRRELARIKRDRNELIESRSQFDLERESLISERRAIDDRTAALDDEQRALATAKAALQSEEDRLQQQLQDVEREEKRLASERDRLRQTKLDVESLQDELAVEREAIQQEDARIREERLRLEASRAELDADRAELDELQRRVTSEHDELKTLQLSLTEQQKELAEQQRLVAASQLRFAEEQNSLQVDQMWMGERRDTAEQELSILESQKDALAKERDEVEQQRRAVESELERLEQSRVALAGEQTAIESEREELGRRREQLDEREADLTAAETEQRDRALSLEQERASWQEELREMDEQRQGGDDSTQPPQHDTTDGQNADLAKSIEEDRIRLDAERDVLERDRESINEQERALSEARQSLEMERARLAEQREEWERERSAHQRDSDDELVEERERLNELQNEIETERARIEAERVELHRQISQFAAAKTESVIATENETAAELTSNETDAAIGETRDPDSPTAEESDGLSHECSVETDDVACADNLAEADPGVSDQLPDAEKTATVSLETWLDVDTPQQSAIDEDSGDDAQTAGEPCEPSIAPDNAEQCDSTAASVIASGDDQPADDVAEVDEQSPVATETAVHSLESGSDDDTAMENSVDEADQNDVDAGQGHAVTDLRSQLAQLFGDYSSNVKESHEEREDDVAVSPEAVSDEQTVDLIDDVELIDGDSEPEGSSEQFAESTTDTSDIDDDNDASVPDLQETSPPESETTATNEAAALPAEEPEEEDSVAAYMARLLTRTNRSGAPAVTAKPSTTTTSPPKENQQSDKETTPAAGANTGIEPDDAEVVSRTVPEVPKEMIRANLDSFRELANMSARTAVAQHASKRLWTTVQLKVSLTAIGTAVTLTLIAANMMGFGPFLIVSALAALATLVMAADLVRTMVSYYRWRSVESAGQWSDEEDSESEALLDGEIPVEITEVQTAEAETTAAETSAAETTAAETTETEAAETEAAETLDPEEAAFEEEASDGEPDADGVR